MSNRLINLAKRVQTIGQRRIHPSEKATLLALADDAREHLGGRSRLTAAQIAEVTGLSRRAIGMAIAELATAGHITRESGEPGAPIVTLVHPGAEPCPAAARGADIAKGCAAIATPGSNHCQGSYSIKDIDQVKPSPTPQRAREPAGADQDEVGQVFAAWDAFHHRVGLQPVARGMARRGAIAARIADHGLGNALMVVDRTERAVKEKRAPKGQGDLFFSFDMVFGVGPAAKITLFERMLDGEFTPAEPRSAPANDQAMLDDCPADEGEAERETRRLVQQMVGASAYASWIAPAALAIDSDELIVTAPGHFAAEQIRNNYGQQLGRAASRAAGRAITAIIEAARERPLSAIHSEVLRRIRADEAKRRANT